jgi:soluble lytic murein transglycosylase
MRLLFPLPYKQIVAEAAENLRISPWLILSIMRAESLYQPTVVSNVGARGLMQIMPTSGARIAELSGYPDFEPAHLDRPEVSIGFGAWYLARLLDYYRGNLPLAIAAYNAGPEAVDRWLGRNSGMSLDEFLEDIPFDQTRKYVATVLTNMEIYSRVYSGGSKGIVLNLFTKLPKPREDLEMF